MVLPIRQQWSLRRIDYSLRRSDPTLNNLLRNFPKFALAAEFPGHEHLKPKALWRCQVIIGAMLGIALLGAYAVQRCCRAVGSYFDLSREGLTKQDPSGESPQKDKNSSKRPGSVDAS